MSIKWVSVFLRYTGILIVALFAPMATADLWQIESEIVASGGRKQCVLASEKISVFDGYTDASMKLVLKNRKLFVVTDSNIDVTEGQITIEVDKTTMFAMDNIEKKTNAVFEKHYADLIAAFIKGRQVVVTLRFWPTWPKTQAYQPAFSLKGFSKALIAYEQCQ